MNVQSCFDIERSKKYISFGEGSYTVPCDAPSIFQFDETTFTVGKYCSFAYGVKVLLGGEHDPEAVSCYAFENAFKGIETSLRGSRGPVVVGNDVWVGTDAMIMSGVTIRDGAVVAARAVVRRDVPAYAIVGGDPAQVLAYRFPPGQVLSLLDIAWWNWERSRIEKAVPALRSRDIQKFIDLVKEGKL